MRWLSLLLFVALTGCWSGADFYSHSRPQSVLSAGNYLMRERGREEPYQVRVETLRDGFVRITNMTGEDVPEEERERVTASFFRLSGSTNRFVVRLTEGTEPGREDRIVYGLMERAADGSFGLSIPACDQTEDLATSHRAEVVSGLARFCVFQSRADLERALRALPASALEERRLAPVRAGR